MKKTLSLLLILFVAFNAYSQGKETAKEFYSVEELKQDFGFDSFNLNGFYATEAALTFAMIAYNLMSLFRTFVLQEKTQKTLTTLRYRTFAIGAYFEKQQGKLVLKIALNKKRRQWFAGLWNYPIQIPFEFSNA